MTIGDKILGTADEAIVIFEIFEVTLEAIMGAYSKTRAELAHEQKKNRKLQCEINRLRKLIPGRQRVWELNRLAWELEASAPKAFPKTRQLMLDDALFLRRLEYDLTDLVNEKNGGPQRGTGKYDDSQWPRGPRP